MMIYMKEIERKHRALAKVCKEIAILDDELDGEQ
jgi:hypothetical protein